LRVEEEEEDDLSVSCYANPSSNIQTGTRINWSVRVSGGDGDYDYDWSGTDGLNSSSRSPSITYYNPGTKRATVTVTDGDGQEDSDTCTINVNSVLAFTQEYQTPIAPAVYLNQVPYTGIADNYRLALFISVLALFSAWIAYVVISYKKNTGELN
jgi:PKD repeat protein